MEKIIICPEEVKRSILLKETTITPHKFLSITDFRNQYYFSYDENTIYYVMKKYSVPYRIAKEYLENLYFIEDKSYSNHKLQFLRDLKNDLIQENQIHFSSTFPEYIKNLSLEVSSYYDLEKYEEKALSYQVSVPDTTLDFPVYEFSSLEEEVHFVCVKIRELIKKNIPLSKIVLCNVSEDYYYTLDKLFSYYGIPIEIPYQNTIYSTTIFQEYLKTGEINLELNHPVIDKIKDILGDLISIEEDETKKEIIIEKAKHTYLPNKRYEEAVTITNIKTHPFQEDEYVYVLGFNQDSLPKIYQDTSYITDLDKKEVDLYDTDYLNEREKKVTAYLLSQIQNLTISYKLSSPFQKYYPSSMIGDYHLEVKREEVNDQEYSNLYNQIRLGEMLDTYYLYGEKDKHLEDYYSQYEDIYNTYDHTFTGINLDSFLEKLSYPLRLSYTSLNFYQECKFKYYLNSILKLGDYEDTFAATVGSLYHEILSLYKKDGFDLDYEWNKYLESKDLSLKDTVLLVRIRKDLEELLNVLQEQQAYTKFNQESYEKAISIKVRDDIAVEFIGFVDKIMYYQKVSDTYFSIVDYKTGKIDTNIEPMKYGLHMQLPIYLYLIEKSHIFDSPIFTGIYYQNILFSYPTWSKDLEKEKKDQYKLKGYSTENTDNLSLFDITYKESELIKSMKYSEEKGFDRYSKTLSDEMVYQLTKYTDKVIHEATDSILKGDFAINPKVYNKENISCKYCNFQDICYHDAGDITYLEKVEDFSFLGGEE